MWLLPRQANAIVEACGVSAADAGAGAGVEQTLDVRIEPWSATIRVELRPASLADGASPGPACVALDPRRVFSEDDARELLGPWLKASGSSSTVAPVVALVDAFRRYELLQLEVRLMHGASGARFTAARALCDDNAAFRNERVAGLLAGAQPEATTRLKALGIDYVTLDGPVGLLSVGAGETMAAMDLLASAGCPAGCFLDISGGFGVEAVTAAFQQVAGLPRLRAVLVNVFGGLTRVDRVAESIVAALDVMQGLPVPLVIRLEGTEAERGRRLIVERGLRCEPTLRGAISATVALASGGAA